MITPHILLVSIFLSTTWGIYLVYTIGDYRHIRAGAGRRRGEVVVAFRKIVVALSLWAICFAYVFRTLCVLAGLGDESAGQVTFFALLGVNIVGSIFVVSSLWFD